MASMRPRLLHLGSEAEEAAKAKPEPSFNEAEAFTPRIRRRILDYDLIGRQRFNEAEAFTPRIPLNARHIGMSRSRFNEAEAFTPRILCR